MKTFLLFLVAVAAVVVARHLEVSWVFIVPPAIVVGLALIVYSDSIGLPLRLAWSCRNDIKAGTPLDE